jgi:hypothetical protein
MQCHLKRKEHELQAELQGASERFLGVLYSRYWSPEICREFYVESTSTVFDCAFGWCIG